MAGKKKSGLGPLLRAWHKWMGLIGVGMLTIFALTGIYLNHKDFWNGVMGIQKMKEVKMPNDKPLKITTANALSGAPISFEQAVATAKKQWGDVPLDKVELKMEKGAYVYKIETPEPKKMLWISASTGETVRLANEAKEGRSFEKFLADLHHLNFGPGWRLGADFFAISLLLLNLTGMWMWARHELAQRRAQKLAREIKAQKEQAQAQKEQAQKERIQKSPVTEPAMTTANSS